MAALTSEQLGVQGLGWIVRRTLQTPADLVRFYSAAWGLRPPRGPGPTGSMMLWAGDLSMLEISTLTPGPSSQSRADDLSVVMRTADFPAALRRMREAGASLVAERSGPPRSAILTGPEGRLLGLRAARPLSEAEAGMRVEALADLPPLPAEIGGIDRVVLRVADPGSLAEFYQRAFGLAPLEPISDSGALLALGRGVTLELRPGGHRHDPPGNRNEVPDVWILRVYDHDALAARLDSMNVQVINRVEITGGILTYAVDPEGHLFGMQQRTRDLLPADRAERAEDTAAWAAWASRDV